MFARFLVPDELHSEQGQNFESQVFGEIYRRQGVSKTRTTPLHLQSDRLVERFNRTLATQLATITTQHRRETGTATCPWFYGPTGLLFRSPVSVLLQPMFSRELRTSLDLVFGASPEPEITVGKEMDYLHRLRDRLHVVHDYATKLKLTLVSSRKGPTILSAEVTLSILEIKCGCTVQPAKRGFPPNYTATSRDPVKQFAACPKWFTGCGCLAKAVW